MYYTEKSLILRIAKLGGEFRAICYRCCRRNGCCLETCPKFAFRDISTNAITNISYVYVVRRCWNRKTF